MPSFFDLQKYAHTGLASPDMTAYDKMRALAAFGGGAVQTLTGIPPLSFRANGKPLISLSMLGNARQTGTPSPQSIIMPTFCGARTANFVDVANLSDVGWATQYPDLLEAINSLPNGVYTMSISYELTARNDTTDSSVCGWYIAKGTSILSSIRISWQNAQIGEKMTVVDTFTINDNNRGAFTALYLYGCGINGVGRTGFATAENIMINAGSTALHYEPYGWAEKITCAGQTVPVYLGQTQTVRRIKKLVLTGEENITSTHTDIGLFNILVTDYLKTAGTITNICSHYRAEINVNGWSDVTDLTCRFYGNAGSPSKLLYIRDSSFSTVDDFKSYLAQQYAAGTPVCVWYVLAEPETGIVNEPLAKIGDYADELHSTDAGVTIPTVNGSNTLTVETELQPSSMTITYKE